MKAYRQIKSALEWFAPESDDDRKKRLDSAVQVWYYHYIERTRRTKGKETSMSPTTNGNETLKIQRTVFDLETFDDVKLVKEINAPPAVDSIDAALAAVGNDKAALLAVINDGLREKARESAYNDISGFKALDDNGEPTTEYSGKFADDSKTKLINAGVLNMAKMYAGGAWDSLSKEKKAEYKNQARDLIRSTPAMLQSLVG